MTFNEAIEEIKKGKTVVRFRNNEKFDDARYLPNLTFNFSNVLTIYDVICDSWEVVEK